MTNWIRRSIKCEHNVVSLNTPMYSDDSEESILLEDTLFTKISDDNPEELIDDILYKYEKWLLKEHKHKDTIGLRLARAKVILHNTLIHGKTEARKIQENCSINATTVGVILKEIRMALKKDYPTRYMNRRKYTTWTT